MSRRTVLINNFFFLPQATRSRCSTKQPLGWLRIMLIQVFRGGQDKRKGNKTTMRFERNGKVFKPYCTYATCSQYIRNPAHHVCRSC